MYYFIVSFCKIETNFINQILAHSCMSMNINCDNNGMEFSTHIKLHLRCIIFSSWIYSNTLGMPDQENFWKFVSLPFVLNTVMNLRVHLEQWTPLVLSIQKNEVLLDNHYAHTPYWKVEVNRILLIFCVEYWW